jgi:hypothetical protein
MPKLTKLPIKEFSPDIVDNCFYVDTRAQEMYRVPLRSIFNWIVSEAKKTGLQIELIDDILYLKKK